MQTSSDRSFGLQDIDNIHYAVRTCRTQLENNGQLRPNDMDFPFAYHYQSVARQTGLGKDEIAKRFYEWGVAHGAFPYAYMAVKGACEHLRASNPKFEIPETIQKSIESALGTTTDFTRQLDQIIAGPTLAR